MGFNQDLLTGAAEGFFGNEYLRDYTHASKTFRTNSYQYAPKLKFLFHVYFDINVKIPNVADGANYGLAVKTVKLPGFNFSIQELNQYNRKRINQTKIKYDPVDITFHDDNGNLIRSLWKSYYTYYYADGQRAKVEFTGNRGGTPPADQYAGGGATASPSSAAYNDRTQYNGSITGNDTWGYIGESSQPNSKKIPFFNNITVFGFNQHNFVAYTLINPLITRCSHDTYNYAEGGGTMEMQMGLDYETVVYNEGAIDGRAPSNIVSGFGVNTTYDRKVSPIARPGSNATILGQGGLVAGVGGTMSALANGNFLGALQAAGTTYNTFKNKNISQIAKAEVLSGITNAVQQTPNRNINFTTPIFGATPQTQGIAGAPTSGTVSAPQQVGPNSYSGTANK